MNGSLESKVDTPSLRQELATSIINYPSTLKEYTKGLAPAFLISATGCALGQWAAHKLGYDSPTAQTAAGYVCGYVPGFVAFFTREYLTNKKKYPRGVMSREFGHFVGTFLAADYLADFTTFTPTFVTSNALLTQHTTLHPVVRGIISWTAGATLYTAAIAGLHPVAKRATSALNSKIKKGITLFRKKK